MNRPRTSLRGGRRCSSEIKRNLCSGFRKWKLTLGAIRPIGTRPTLIAVAALSLLLASLSLASTALAAAPGADSPRELIGPIPPSILVPPVRTSPPARTRPIPRPPQYDAKTTARKRQLPYRMESLRLAIDDLQATYGEAYASGPQFRNAGMP